MTNEELERIVDSPEFVESMRQDDLKALRYYMKTISLLWQEYGDDDFGNERDELSDAHYLARCIMYTIQDIWQDEKELKQFVNA